MNRSHVICEIFAAVTLLCHALLFGQSIDVPFLAGRVNDTANMLSPQTITELEALLKTHEDSTSNQVVVLTIPSLQGAVLEEYSMKVAETWKLGQADKDNGVLLLVARDDRKVRIEVGSGLEGNLPDITCGRIIRNEIVSRFRDGNFDAGISNGMKAILLATEGSYVADTSEASKSDSKARRNLIISVVGGLIIWLFVYVLSSRSARPSSSRNVKKLQKNRVASSKKRRSQVERSSWWAGSMESSFSSGDSSSNDSSGGGFSGGGGDFSGGGASGSW